MPCAALKVGESLHPDKEINMSQESSQEYQRAVEEAASAFMKVMALRGFNVRDYPQNFVAQMTQNTRLAFEANRNGAHARADTLVSDMLRTAPIVDVKAASSTMSKVKQATFPLLRRHMA